MKYEFENKKPEKFDTTWEGKNQSMFKSVNSLKYSLVLSIIK